MSSKHSKNILLAISGSIAAYKVLELVRDFVKNGYDIKCILTESAKEFVTVLTLQTLSKNKVYTSMFDNSKWELDHIELANWADILIVAPATAQTISKLAVGNADDILTCTALSFKKPIIICPAMNENMWLHPATVANCKKIKEYGYIILEPQNGELACGVIGAGRLIDIKEIYNKTVELLK